jgi:RHS repeat-associated protein
MAVVCAATSLTGIIGVSIVAPSIASATTTIPSPGTGWDFNGSASLNDDGSVQLTSAGTYQAGSAWYATALSVSSLTVTFDVNMSGGSGADGVTVDLLDATADGPTSVGSNGGGLGFGGLSGIGVGFDTYDDGCTGDVSSNFVGVTDGSTCGGAVLNYHLGSSNLSTELHGATTPVTVTFNNGSSPSVDVSVDGTELDEPVTSMPSSAYLGFTGATGAATDVHTVSDFSISDEADSAQLGSGNPASNSPHPCAGDPVDCATGNFSETYADLSIPGRGPGLDLTRTYNSLAASTEGPFGYGWSTSYGMNLAVDSDSGNVTVTQEDGSTVEFEPSDGAYTAAPNVQASLVQNEDGTWTFTRRKTEIFTFSEAGQLTSIDDLNGNATTLSYDDSGNLTTVTDSSGRTITFAYGTNGLISTATDSSDRVVSYTYDDNGNLTSVTDPDGNVTSFTYDSNHYLDTITGPDGGVLTNVYDSSGQVTSQTDPLGRVTSFDYGDNETTITEPDGSVTDENFSDGELTSITQDATDDEGSTALPPPTGGTPNGPPASWQYNGSATCASDASLWLTPAEYYQTGDAIYTGGTVTTNGLKVAFQSDAEGGSGADGWALMLLDPSDGSSALGTTGGGIGWFGLAGAGIIFHQFSDDTEYDYAATEGGTTTTEDSVSDSDLGGTHTWDVQFTETDPGIYTVVITKDGSAYATWTGMNAPDTVELGFSGATGGDDNNYYISDTTITTSDGTIPTPTCEGSPPASWQYNGSAQAASDGSLWLTPATGGQAGDAIYNGGTVTTNGLDVAFQSDATGGSGADGWALMLLDPSDGTSALGSSGGGVGFDGLDGAAIKFHQYSNDTEYDYQPAGGSETTEASVSDSDLGGTNTWDVQFTKTDPGIYTVTITKNGSAYATWTGVNTPNSVELGFSGGTGGETNNYYIDDTTITAQTYGLTTTYSYDSTGGIASETDPDGNTTSFTYDADGNVTSETDPLGHTTTTTYNSLDEPLTVTDPAGIETEYTYDSNGNLTSKTVDGHDGLTTTSTYTVCESSCPSGFDPGDLESVTDPDGNTTSYTYDTYGDLASTSVTAGSQTDTTKYAYNSLGELYCETSPNATADSVTCPSFGSSRVADTTTYTYDADGNETSVTDPDGNMTSYAYDGDGDVTSVTDPVGNVTENVYDDDGEVTSVTNGYGTSSAATTTYTYETPIESCPSSVTGAAYCDQTTNPDDETTTSYYDALGRLVESVPPDSTEQDPTSYTYDGDGNVLTMTDGAGTTSYTYNADNQLHTVTDTSTNSGYTADDEVTYAYDADGNRTQMVDGSGTTTYTYDGLERLESTTDGAGNTVTYGYDDDGNVTCLSYPNEANNTCQDVGSGTGIVTYDYNAAGETTSMTDWLGNTTDFSYDHDSNLTSTDLPSGTDTTVADGYDNADNLNSVSVTTDDTPTTLADLTFNSDELITANSVGSGSSDDYDPLNQLTSAGGTSYNYDGADQLTSSESGGDTTDYAYDDDGELCWTGSTSGSCSSPPSGTTTYTYNTSGERTAETPSGGDPTTYGWSQAGTLTCETASNNSSYTCADPNSSVTSTYTYNGDGLRVADTPADGSTQNFTWNTLGESPQLLEDGTDFYLYGPNAGAAPIEQISIGESTPTYLISDDTGVREAVDSSGDNAGTNTYDAYGNCVSCSLNTPFGYGGGYTDATGLIFLVNRYYDSSTGQFVSVDPEVGLTLAPYSYANDDPVNEVDPDGLFGLNPFSDIAEAANDVGGAVASGAKWVAHHPLETAGIVVGAVSLVTGVGEIAGATFVIGDVTVGATGLGVTSFVTGGIGTGLDLNACRKGNAASCVGLGLSLPGLASGVVGLLPEGLVPDGVSTSLKYLGLATGAFGYGWDTENTIASGVSQRC